MSAIQCLRESLQPAALVEGQPASKFADLELFWYGPDIALSSVSSTHWMPSRFVHYRSLGEVRNKSLHALLRAGSRRCKQSRLGSSPEQTGTATNLVR